MPTGRKIEKNFDELKRSSVSFRISVADHTLLRLLAEKMDLSQTQVFEVAVRRLAKQQRVGA